MLYFEFDGAKIQQLPEIIFFFNTNFRNSERKIKYI